MKKAISVLIVLMLILSLCSCAGLIGKIKPSASANGIPSAVSSSPEGDATQLPSETPEPSTAPSEKPSPSVKPSAEPSPPAAPSEKPPSVPFGGNLKPTPVPSSHPSSAPSPSASNEKTPLTAESLAYWTDYFAQQENNGFLLSSYDEPEDIDLQQLFYAGAGIASWDVTQKETNAYLDYYGYDELWGGLMKLTTDQVDDFLMEKMGISYWDTWSDMGWVYLEQFDAYFVERSDTNYGFFECVSGYKTANGTVVVQCQVPDGYGQQVDKCTVTLKKSGSRYLFYSNDAHMTY
jgi:hypothetical protein